MATGRARRTEDALRFPGAHRPPRILLSISGRRRAKRTEVLLNENPSYLPPESLRILLRLVLERVSTATGFVTLEQLARIDGKVLSWKGISRLNDHIRVFLPDGESATDNDQNGGYRLHPDIQLGPIDHASLGSHPDPAIRSLARRIGEKAHSEGSHESESAMPVASERPGLTPA
jgi:hypothetical protein